MSVSGQGSVTRAPDRTTVSFDITTANEQSAAATSANNAIVTALTQKLAAFHLPPGAVVTRNYAVSYNPRPPKPEPAERYGYTVDRTIDVVDDNVDAAGALVDAGIAAGVTGVNGIAFSLRDPHSALLAAQTVAYQDAVAQAKNLAATAGLRLVRITSISPGGQVNSPVIYRQQKMMAMAAPAPTQIDAGNLTVQANVSIVYEIDTAAH